MTSATWVGREFDVEVGPVAHGGHCVARHDGRVVFVRHAIPGERVRVLVTEDRGGSFCRADAIDVLEPSPDRVVAPCVAAGPGGCGGCDFQHVRASAQRDLKAQVVREQLQRLAGIEWDGAVEEVAPSPLGWRTRMQYAVHDGTIGLRQHRSHTIVEIAQCPIAVAGAQVDIAREYAVDGAVSIEVDSGANRRSTVTSLGRRGNRRIVAGGPQRHRVHDRDFMVRPGGFWQVHSAAAEVLVDAVLAYADAQPGECIVDLFCGVGLFTAALGEAVGVTGRVIGVEGTRSAVEDGVANVADLPQCEIRRDSVGPQTLTRIPGPIDLVVLDPPRAGAKRPLVDAVVAAEPRAVIYVACDPAALARDVAIFAAHGWRLSGLRAFDLFPMTHHVECVALLTKTGSDLW